MIRAIDIIRKKQEKEELTEEELRFFVEGVTDGTLPDYQISAFLMAVYFNGMTKKETILLAQHMAKSGDVMDLSAIKGIKGDKHSTGGIGDKTSLIVVPLLAECGIKVAKMSGRALGYTGGTVDKLESIPGMRLQLEKEEFFHIVDQCGASIISQTGNICPADKRLYQLRDVTGTVASLPLIAASIMSKKLAAGADIILLDVKMGGGAFMKTKEEAFQLAEIMVEIGKASGKKTIAVITNMDIPLGNAVGNMLEIAEAVHTLKGNGPEDITELCIKLSGMMVASAKDIPSADAEEEVRRIIASGRAVGRFAKMVEMQGGNGEWVRQPEYFPKAKFQETVTAEADGYICMEAEKYGETANILGAGRLAKDSGIDRLAGLVLYAKSGEFVKKGDAIAALHSSKLSCLKEGRAFFESHLKIAETCTLSKELIYGTVE